MSETFNFEDFKLPTAFSDQVSVKKQLIGIPVRKPKAQEFVRTASDTSYRRDVALLHVKDDMCFYAVAPHLIDALSDLVTPYTLVTAVTRQMSVFLWPIQLPGQDGRSHGSAESQRAAANLAQDKWVRIQWNRSESAYDVAVAEGIPYEPEFPDKTFNELLGIAFKGLLIDSLDHLIVQQLRGQA